MGKHRAKRFSGALERYLKNPQSEVKPDLKLSEKLKVANPEAEFEAIQKEQEAPFKIPAAEPKPIQTQKEIVVTSELSETNNQLEEVQMPLYCNFCDLVKSCPDGRGFIKRKDQKELVVCKRRGEFRKLITEAGTNTRDGLLGFIHKLRQINAVRIGQMLYKESLSNSGQDRNLSLLIDKQIDAALAEYKLLTPSEKNSGFSFRLTAVHKTVDTFNELPANMKTYLLDTLKQKLAEIKSPLTVSKLIEIGKEKDPANRVETTEAKVVVTGHLDKESIKHPSPSKDYPLPVANASEAGGGKARSDSGEGFSKDETAGGVEDL